MSGVGQKLRELGGDFRCDALWVKLPSLPMLKDPLSLACIWMFDKYSQRNQLPKTISQAKAEKMYEVKYAVKK